MPDRFQLIETADGSHSLIHPVYGEMYHSKHGAITESQHVFIEAGLLANSKGKNIHILEMGMGTGLNVLLTAIHQKPGTTVYYAAIEKYPIPTSVASQINYLQQIQRPDFEGFWHQVHLGESGKFRELRPQFFLKKLFIDWKDLAIKETFDLIYFDAFAPNAQNELWTEAVFETTFKMLNKGGILCTYCAKGSVKRALKKAGFKVESLPGPPGKREMTRAMKV